MLVHKHTYNGGLKTRYVYGMTWGLAPGNRAMMLSYQNLGVNQANRGRKGRAKTLAAKGLAPNMTGRVIIHIKHGMESSIPQHRPRHRCLSVHWRSVDGTELVRPRRRFARQSDRRRCCWRSASATLNVNIPDFPERLWARKTGRAKYKKKIHCQNTCLSKLKCRKRCFILP